MTSGETALHIQYIDSIAGQYSKNSRSKATAPDGICVTLVEARHLRGGEEKPQQIVLWYIQVSSYLGMRLSINVEYMDRPNFM